ncbi:hypothetical protein FOMPIDRAFT_1056432 [Fomitopsis schrenkii]|uniref:Uncharacterized protein n=1 Tax=Fomitopsis schrenkii TaxID=2126942 RepID=S8DHB7_FOMSC|nr:hypothetical protein FOMPIDRAFT_1056432 [Fomitopsis schrenkii]
MERKSVGDRAREPTPRRVRFSNDGGDKQPMAGTETQDGRAGVVPERTVDVPAAGGNTHKAVETAGGIDSEKPVKARATPGWGAAQMEELARLAADIEVVAPMDYYR